jgi:hypothetical protein
MPARAAGPMLDDMLEAPASAMDLEDVAHSSKPDALQEIERFAAETQFDTVSMDTLLDTSDLDKTAQRLQQQRARTEPPLLSPFMLEDVTNEFAKVEYQWNKCKKTISEAARVL